MHLSCLSTFSVKWSTFVSSARIAFMTSTRVTSVGVEGGPETRGVLSGSSTVSTSTIRPRILREIIMRNSCQERFRSLVRDTSLPLRKKVRSKLLAQRQWANTRAVVT